MSMINALQEIDAVIARLRDGDEDQAREAVSRLAWLFGQVAERKKAYQQALLAWVDAHDDLTVGQTRYYVGKKTKYVEHDRLKTLDAMLESAAGDLEKIGDCISKNGIKHGAIKQLLGIGESGRFGECFKVEVDLDLKTGKPLKVLKEDRRGDQT